jgi:uncharacterized protein DUF4390
VTVLGQAGRTRRQQLLFFTLSTLLGAFPLRAQDSVAAQLQVTLSADSAANGRRAPLVRTSNLLKDAPWIGLLRQGLPVRLRYRIEVWRSREAWLDALVRQSEWNLLIRHEPLLDQYSVLLAQGRSRTRRQVGTAGALEELLGLQYRIPAVAPTEPGTYYYAATLDVTTLSDSDVDELERFLRGELVAEGDTTTRRGSVVSRGARRLVLTLAGLPSLTLTGRSETFEVR